MGLFGNRKKRGGTLSRQLAHSLLEDAMSRAEAEQSGYRHVRTAQGRTAHLQQAPPGVLCGWRGPWVPAEPELPVCRTCQAEMEKLSSERVAS